MQGQQIDVVRQFRATASIVSQGGEVRQVLANLIGNAMDALPDGGRIVVRTTAARNWRSGSRGIAVTVSDNGTGMDEATLSRVFEPFFSTKGITGTGLGLWISKELIAKHEGNMRVRSRAAVHGKTGGTVFRVFLPTQNEGSLLVDSNSEAKKSQNSISALT